MAVLLFVLTQIGILGNDTSDPAGRCSSPLLALVIYTPLAYMTDKWVYARMLKRQGAQKKSLMEARWLTVGPVQENTWIARQDGRRRRRC